MPVTRNITCLIGDHGILLKPSFATIASWGIDPKLCLKKFNKKNSTWKMMSKKKRILKKHDTVNGSEILQSPVEVGSVSHNLQGFSTIPRWNSQNFYFCYPTFWVVFPIVVVPWNFKTSPRLTTSGSIPVLMICGASFSFWTYDRKQRREKNQLAGPTATNEGMRVQDLHPQVIPGSKGWGTLIPYESGQPEKCLVGEKKSLGRRKENSEDFAGKGAKTSKKKKGEV